MTPAGTPSGTLPGQEGARPLVELRDVARTYWRGDEAVQALRGVSLSVEAGDFLVVTGPSGSGKSTLLHIMAGLDRPSSGEVLLDGIALSGMSDDDLTERRRRSIGFIFQFFHLLPTLSALDNIGLPLLLDGQPTGMVHDAAARALAEVGLAHRAAHRPREMSGGEQQRVAIARALVIRPTLILADEPTGNLDSASGADILRILREAPASYGAAVVLVTHQPDAALPGERTVFMRDGVIETASIAR
ncbi:MAG TPA: ABC transporter ATP-binding protein [Actinomycetota bacterium]|nr:ABC transporter ATP-binding protein [Actinomycetota bacterium]